MLTKSGCIMIWESLKIAMADMFDSNTVSDVLDWVGFSASEISWRIKLWQKSESMKNVKCRITGVPCMVLITGSRAEGVGMNVLNSDTDMMICDQTKRIIFHFGDWQLLPDTITCIVDTLDVHPGYCRLKVTHMHEPTLMNVEQISMLKDYVLTYKGEVVLNNEIYLTKYFNRQGPANTYQCSYVSMDGVHCYQTCWPPFATEWIHRDRPRNYPPIHIIHEAERRGIHVVPTGYKGSEYHNIQWRFSFSVTELNLIQIWPNVVLKCYVLLKLLKNVITRQSPHLSHTLSSYHLKTLLFWLTEETGLDHWNSHSLIECLMFSLDILLCWVERGCISHYFIKNNNLFDMEAGTSRQSDLVTALRVLVSEGPLVLVRCEIYQNWCSEKNRIQPTHKRVHVVEERAALHVYFGVYVMSTFEYTVDHLCSADIRKSIVRTIDAMRELTVFSTQCDHDVSMATDYVISGLRSTCGTMLLSFLYRNLVSNTTRYNLFKMSEQILKGSIGNDIVQLKLANYYYIVGLCKKATAILQLISEKNHGRLKISIFGDAVISAADVERLSEIESPFDAFRTNIATSLVFVLPEIHATAYALKFEMFIPDNPHSNPREEQMSWCRQHALVDQNVFVYYLQYLCYRQMGKQRHAEVAFNKLRWIVKSSDVMHRESGLNILGCCFLERDQLRRAANCFVKSLQVQSKYTVAPIHLAILIGKAISQR